MTLGSIHGSGTILGSITLTIMAIFSDESTIGSTLLIPGWIFGALYFPMALLAVAMKDTPIAANPLIVVPAIFKVLKWQ